MKLKILPSSIRDKKRYIAFEAVSQSNLNREDVIGLIWENSLNLYGECGTSKFGLWIMKLWDQSSKKYENDYYVKGIIQCNRNEVDKVRAAMSVITKIKGKRVVFHTLGVAGTIKSATLKFISQ
ncbi:MAG: Rpp14/Pop5 family protein [Methanomicrobiales archaeon]